MEGSGLTKDEYEKIVNPRVNRKPMSRLGATALLVGGAAIAYKAVDAIFNNNDDFPGGSATGDGFMTAEGPAPLNFEFSAETAVILAVLGMAAAYALSRGSNRQLA